jgi:hypothetical protein
MIPKTENDIKCHIIGKLNKINFYEYFIKLNGKTMKRRKK